MGEAGAEAVMPLGQTSDGSLGVKAIGGGSPNVTINVENQTGRNIDATMIEPSFNAEQMTLGIVLKAVNNNTGGFNTQLKAAIARG